MNRNNSPRTNQPDSPTRRDRREQAEQEWRKNPIRKYHESQDLVELHESRERMVVERFNEFLHGSSDVPDSVTGVRDVIEDDIEQFINTELDPDPDLGDSTIIDYLDTLSKFYNVLVTNNAIGTNPVKEKLSEEREARDCEAPNRPFIPFGHMQTFLKWLDTPFARAFILTGLKTSSRSGEAINTDLRCCHIDHPIFWHLVDKYDVTLDPRIRDKPDSILIYEEFRADEEIPNSETPGPEKDGEERQTGNKRKEKGGSIIPVDSELKTALVEYLLARPETTSRPVQPLFTNSKQEEGNSIVGRLGPEAMRIRLFMNEDKPDSLKRYGKEQILEECPDCRGTVIEWNSVDGEKTGRVFQCQDCEKVHRRAILWDHGLETEQKVTFQLFRHYFSDAHREGSSQLHDKELLDRVRQYRIRGDRDSGDSDKEVYQHKQNQDWEEDVREPYLNKIYKFGLYDTVIPAVGEGWKT